MKMQGNHILFLVLLGQGSPLVTGQHQSRDPHNMFGSSDSHGDEPLPSGNMLSQQADSTRADADLRKELRKCVSQLSASSQALTVSSSQEACCFQLRRIISRLYRQLPSTLDAVEGVYLLQLSLTTHDKDTLHRIAQTLQKLEVAELSAAANTLLEALGPAYVAPWDDVYLTSPWLRRLRHELPTACLIVAMFALFLFVWRLCVRISEGTSLRGAVTAVVLAALLLSVGNSYMRLYQRAVAKQRQSLGGSAPKECLESSKAGWFSSLVKQFSMSMEDPCAKYYYSLTVDPFFEVTIFQAFSEALTQGLVQPAEQVAKAINSFIHLLLSDLPWHIQLLVFVVFVFYSFFALLRLLGFNLRSMLFSIERNNRAEHHTLLARVKQLEIENRKLENALKTPALLQPEEVGSDGDSNKHGH